MFLLPMLFARILTFLSRTAFRYCLYLDIFFVRILWVSYRMQATLVIRAFAILISVYALFFLNIMKRFTILSTTKVEAATQAQSFARPVSLVLPTILTPVIQIKPSENPRSCCTFHILRTSCIHGDPKERNSRV
jgi:hypothetical protein